eukprot:202032_1
MSTAFRYFIHIFWVITSSKIHPSLYGNDSGLFGQWTQQTPYNLPAYIYTLDQINNPIATEYNSSVVYQSWDHPLPSRINITDHSFQFGNDRITVVASNYGYIQMRSDESAPKLLNDFNPSNNAFGAGIAYITTNINNKEQLLTSTYFTGNSDDHREYSFYYRTYITNSLSNVQINQSLITPFGQDPIVISQVTLYSTKDISNLNYYETYSGAMYQLVGQTPSYIRQYQIQNYNVTYSYQQPDGNHAMLAYYQYTGPKQNIPNVKNGWLYDERPPQLFVSTVGKNNNFNVHYGCDNDAFFGSGGAKMPTFQINGCDNGVGNIKSAGIIIKISDISLQKDKPITFYIMSGYIPHGFKLNELIQKYNDENGLNDLKRKTAQNWYNDAIKFNTTKYPEISREILWDYGYTRTSLSFYDLYNESILDQGTWYRYINGFQGAFRDPLQHMLPLIFTAPNKVKSIIRFELKQIQPKFNDVTRYVNVPYALMGNGIMFDMSVSAAPSDLEIYLLWSVSEYILATKDINFLSENIYLNVYDETENDYVNYSVLDCLMESYQYLRSHIGIGKHGVIRLQTGDWSDTFDTLSGANKTLVYEQGESGLNTAMAAYALPLFNKVLTMINKSVPEINEFAQYQQNILHNVLWNGEWINRAWVPNNFSSDGEWLGSLQNDNRMHLFPQIWTLLSGVLNKTETNILINSINKRLREYTNAIGATNVVPPYNNPTGTINGTHECIRNVYFKNKNDNKKTNFSNENIPSQQPHTIIVHQDPNHNNKQMSYLLPLGVACSISLGGYYYYIHSSGTKKVITKVEDTAAETQTLVQKTDDNNAQRFEILDEKNESRAQTLETEIRSEQRAGFNIISEQLYCLTQVAIQTLSALASSNNDPSVNENDNTNDNNEKLLNYCDKAQEMADTILSDEHLLTAKDNNLKDIKAEIQLRNQQQQRVIISNSNNNNITPGGPMDNNNNNNNNNIFDLNHNQQPKIMNNINGDNDDNNNGNMLGNILYYPMVVYNNGMKMSKVGYYMYKYKNEMILSSGVMFALYIGNKTINYYYYSAKKEISGKYKNIQ